MDLKNKGDHLSHEMGSTRQRINLGRQKKIFGGSPHQTNPPPNPPPPKHPPPQKTKTTKTHKVLGGKADGKSSLSAGALQKMLRIGKKKKAPRKRPPGRKSKTKEGTMAKEH